MQKVCERCHDEFEPKSNNQKYCGKCAHELDKQHKRKYINERRRIVKITEDIKQQEDSYNVRLSRKIFPKEDDGSDLIRMIAETNESIDRRNKSEQDKETETEKN